MKKSSGSAAHDPQGLFFCAHPNHLPNMLRVGEPPSQKPDNDMSVQRLALKTQTGKKDFHHWKWKL